jgi:predicted acyltransferase
MYIGQILNTKISKIEILKKIALMGCAMLSLGLIWSLFFPINKSLWTSSYVLYTGGIATVSLAMLYYIIDVAHLKKWTKLLLVWGVNPMIVFFFSGIIPRVLSSITIQEPNTASEQINLHNLIYNHWLVPFFENPLNSSLAFAMAYGIIWTLILWWFYENKLIFKV